MTLSAISRKAPAGRASRLRTLLRRFARDGEGTRGVAAIEFAMIGMFLVLLSIPTVDFGMGFYRKMQVQDAAQAGAQAVMKCAFKPKCVFNAATIQEAVVQATSANASPNFSGITALVPVQFCGCPTGSDIADLGSLPPCTAVCPDGSNSGTYVRVLAQATYSTLLSYPAPIPSQFVLAAKSTARLQ